MKVVFVIENYHPHIGGVEIVFKQLAEALAEDKKNDIVVITHKLPKSKEYEIINNVKIYRVPVPSILSRYFFTFLALPKILKLAKDADILHTTTYNGAPPTRWAAMILKKPSVITIHEVIGKKWITFRTMNYLSAHLHKFLERLVVTLNFNTFVCVSRSTQRDLLNTNPDCNSVVVYNGVDTRFWDPARYSGMELREKYDLKGRFVYLAYGRPGITKGFEFLVRAVKKISKEIPGSLLFMILSKDEQYIDRHEMILDLIEELEIQDNVKIIDPVPRSELPNYIKMSDCVVVPSLSEGFGFTTAESCYMQKPVVVSDTTSLPEVVFGDYVLVRPRSPESIAQGVIDIFNNRGIHSKKKNFSVKKNIDGYKEVYEKLLKKDIIK